MKRKILILVMAAICLLSVSLAACSGTTTTTPEEEQTEVAFDVTRFIDASYDDVVVIMGEPAEDNVRETVDSLEVRYFYVPYTYDGWEQKFAHVDFTFMKHDGRWTVTELWISQAFKVETYLERLEPLNITKGTDMLEIFGIKSDAKPIKVDGASGFGKASTAVFYEKPRVGIDAIKITYAEGLDYEEIIATWIYYK